MSLVTRPALPQVVIVPREAWGWRDVGKANKHGILEPLVSSKGVTFEEA